VATEPTINQRVSLLAGVREMNAGGSTVASVREDNTCTRVTQGM
jgi:hypothetical protein